MFTLILKEVHETPGISVAFLGNLLQNHALMYFTKFGISRVARVMPNMLPCAYRPKAKAPASFLLETRTSLVPVPRKITRVSSSSMA